MTGFRWSPTIGDPTFVGWLTVFAYFLASWLCLRAFMAEKSGPRRPYGASVLALLRVLRRHGRNPPLPAKRAAIWLVLATILALLGVNKQLDLQTLFTDIARLLARHQGWYESRGVVQLVFLVLIVLLAIPISLGLFRLARKALVDFRLALFGMSVLMLFVIARAASFHHMDRLLGEEVIGLRLNWVLEIPGIVLVGAAALRRVRQRRD